MEVTKLCSDYDWVHRVVCDLPYGHGGEHRAVLLWGYEGDDADE